MVDRRGIFRNAVDLAIRDAVSGYRSTDWALFGDVAADLEVRAAGPDSRRVTSAACLIASSNVRQRPGSFSYEGQRRYGVVLSWTDLIIQYQPAIRRGMSHIGRFC